MHEARMPALEHLEFVTATKSQRLLGLDLGSKTIGLAVSDTAWMVASPLKTLKRSKFTKDAQTLPVSYTHLTLPTIYSV